MDFVLNLLAGAIRVTIPIAFAALAGVLSERSGVINMGLEGMMLMGSFFGVVGSYLTGNQHSGQRSFDCIVADDLGDERKIQHCRGAWRCQCSAAEQDSCCQRADWYGFSNVLSFVGMCISGLDCTVPYAGWPAGTCDRRQSVYGRFHGY